MTIVKYIIYARVSSERQRENTSLQDQVDKCVRYVGGIVPTGKEQHLLFPNPYGDGTEPYVISDVESAGDVDGEVYNYIAANNINGFFKEKRPALWRAMGECFKYGCNLVVAYVDRLSRQTVIEQIIQATFDSKRLAVFCADVSSDLERNIKSLLAQEENRQRRKKIIAGVTVAKKTVKETGKYPNGREAKYFDADGNPRYGGPANSKGSLAAQKAAEAHTQRFLNNPRTQAMLSIMDLFAEQDLMRLKRRCINLKKANELRVGITDLKQDGYAINDDNPLTYPSMVYIANVYKPNEYALLKTENGKPYGVPEFQRVMSKLLGSELIDPPQFVRVKLYEAMYKGDNVASCIYMVNYGDKNRKGENKRMVSAYLIRYRDYVSLVSNGEAAFDAVISTAKVPQPTYLPQSTKIKIVQP